MTYQAVCVECGEVLEITHSCGGDLIPHRHSFSCQCGVSLVSDYDTIIDVKRLAHALEAFDPDDDGNRGDEDPTDYFMRKASHLAALYRTVDEPMLPRADLSLMDTVGERSHPERPVMLQRGPFYDGMGQPPPPAPG